jgi:hypothetical protein
VNDEKMEEEDVIGTAYRDSIRSADGFSRGPGGRVKFNKDTKKRRREELKGEIEDVEMGDVTTVRMSKKRSPEKLGKEFRSKVRAFQTVYGTLVFVTDRSIESSWRCQKRWSGPIRLCYAPASCKEKGRKNYE